MRVLLVNDLPPGPTGGAEVHVGRVADALTAAGAEVRLVVAEALHVGWRRVFDVWDVGARRMVRREIQRFEPDVVHLHNVLNELSTSVVGNGSPTVLTVHDPRVLGVRFGLDQDRPPWAPATALRSAKDRFARRRLRRGVDATIAPSRSLADALERAGFPAVHHVENFAPSGPVAPLGRDVVYVGALSAHKGPQVLVEAWGRIADKHPGTTLRLVGDGPLRSSLEQTVARRPSGRVVLHGVRAPAEVADVIAMGCVVAVPSLGVEGGGPTLAVIEAMAAGRPVVVSDRPGVVEGVDEQVGEIVPADDALALAAALDGLLGDRARLERLGCAAAERAASRWTPERAAARLLGVYGSVAR